MNRDAGAAPMVAHPWLPSSAASGTVLYPEGSFGGGGSRWVQWTISEPYARQHDFSGSNASPFVDQLTCECGTSPNPDGCVTGRSASAPFVAWHPSSASAAQWQFSTPFELPPR